MVGSQVLPVAQDELARGRRDSEPERAERSIMFASGGHVGCMTRQETLSWIQVAGNSSRTFCVLRSRNRGQASPSIISPPTLDEYTSL